MPRNEYTDAHEKIFELARQAYTLTDAQLDSLKPGPYGLSKAIRLLGDDESYKQNRLSSITDMDNFHVEILKVFRDPEWFPFTCRHLFNKPDGSGPLEILPFQHIALLELWWRQFPMIIASRGAGKSFLLALYALLRATFTPGARMIITAAAFRQAKAVFEYMERIWYGSPIFRNLVNSGQGGGGRKNGPRRDIDRVEFVIGDSVVIGLPLGTGEKIRGLRANYILSDEVASIPEDVYSVVVQGFASVTADPINNVKDYARIKLLKILGLWNADMDAEEAKRVRGNQSVLTGTAYYSFNHFCKYWREYKAILETKGDKKKLEEVMKGPVPDGYNFADYSIIRLPYTLIPHGYMDSKTIARAKQITNTGQFVMEYETCTKAGTNIITSRGIKEIENVKVGDEVLTHKGRFRKVTGTTSREYNGKIVNHKTYGYPEGISTTPEHPFWKCDDEWVASEKVEGHVSLARLKELNGRTEIDLEDYVDDFHETMDGTKIYASSSQALVNRKTVSEIRARRLTGETLKSIGDSFGLRICTIHEICKNRKEPKGAIYKKLPLNYEFGLIVGYFASEGSAGANGKAAVFSMDGHVDEPLANMVTHLESAIKNVFGLSPRIYKNQSVSNVTVNNRLFVDLIKKICPGVCYDKFVDPEILYSNEEFLSGFITGFWNGDGHKNNLRNCVVATITSRDLISQVRVAASYFGIPFSLRKFQAKNAVFRGQTYNTRVAHSIYCSGKNGSDFKTSFWNLKPLDTKYKATKAIIHEDRFEWETKSKEIVDYAGKVYNLHVEEDESYSLPIATIHNCFKSDSEGFFKRTLLESCTVGSNTNPNPPSHPSAGGVVKFTASVSGDPSKKYVYGVDPASERDQFAVVILECWPDHRRVVYAWTTTKSDHRKRLKNKTTADHDFYRYCVRKIRNLMKTFPCERLLVDHGGGGVALREALGDPDRLEPGEFAIHETIDDNKEKPTDELPGLKILEMVVFRNNAWVVEANHGLKKDMETHTVLFPNIDPLALGLAQIEDEELGRVSVNEEGDKVWAKSDTLESCMMEIEELKSELATIVITSTSTGMEHWDTPDKKMEGTATGRMRKDRYSAMLMANMGARQIARAIIVDEYQGTTGGGFTSSISKNLNRRCEQEGKSMYAGATWAKDAANACKSYGAVVRRTGV